nr:MAG TPA: hypothetical protein [Caudoviricetes sp.]
MQNYFHKNRARINLALNIKIFTFSFLTSLHCFFKSIEITETD